LEEKMRYRIHYTLPCGEDDSFELEGEDIEGLINRASEEVAKRHGSDPWSEELK
jgi:hypothetical protein